MRLGSQPVSCRRLIKAALPASLILLIAACTNGPAATSATSAGAAPPKVAASPESSASSTAKPAATPVTSVRQKVSLRFWTYYEATTRASQFPSLIKKYESANPGVTINLNDGFQDYDPTVHTAMLGGDPPELLAIDESLMCDFVNAMLLRDLSDDVKQSGLDQKFYPVAVSGVKIKGKLYALADACALAGGSITPRASTI